MAVFVILLAIAAGLHGENLSEDVVGRESDIANSNIINNVTESTVDYGVDNKGVSPESDSDLDENKNIYKDGDDNVAVTVKNNGFVDVCGVCSCGEIREENGKEIVMNVMCSELDRVDDIPDLNRITWPGNPHGLNLAAAFEGIGLTTVESLPANNRLKTLSFSNNLIKTTWPGAFSDLPNLSTLSLSQNQLKQITVDMFTGLRSLEKLDLSNNQLTEFNSLDFVELKRLRVLNLQNNNISRVPEKMLADNKELEELDLSYNAIKNFKFKSESNLLKSLTRLDLSGNNITNISVGDFPPNNLKFLDLSNNMISVIDKSAFKECGHLEELLLSSNQIAAIFTVPVAAQSVSLAHNYLPDWPDFPIGIAHIDISYNQLYDLYDQNYVDFDFLRTLNIAGNQLARLDLTVKLPNLRNLDISYNTLEDIPPSVNMEMLPELDTLTLDGNPLKGVNFPQPIALSTLHLNDLQIDSLNDSSLVNVLSRNDSGGCVRLYLSNCPNLAEISQRAFEGPSICLLDLSYNNLTRIPADAVVWSGLSEGLDLQGNPWDCVCPMQWMLDDLLPLIHSRYPQYLGELRCASPRAREGLRMVHWLNWGQKVLCRNGYLSEPNQSYMLESDSSQLLPGVSMLTLILSGCILAALLIVAALATYLVRARSRAYRVRRALAERRRQTAQDAKRQPEQFKALNRA